MNDFVTTAQAYSKQATASHCCEKKATAWTQLVGGGMKIMESVVRLEMDAMIIDGIPEAREEKGEYIGPLTE